jgi:hypothetical protein
MCVSVSWLVAGRNQSMEPLAQATQLFLHHEEALAEARGEAEASVRSHILRLRQMMDESLILQQNVAVALNNAAVEMSEVSSDFAHELNAMHSLDEVRSAVDNKTAVIDAEIATATALKAQENENVRAAEEALLALFRDIEALLCTAGGVMSQRRVAVQAAQMHRQTIADLTQERTLLVQRGEVVANAKGE